jgi:hypothetical protein
LAVGLGAEDRRGANRGGAATRAASWGSTTRGAGGTCGVSVRGGAGGMTGSGGVDGSAGPAACGGFTGVTGAAAWGRFAERSAQSGLGSAKVLSTGWLAAGAAGSPEIDSRNAGTCSSFCFSGEPTQLMNFSTSDGRPAASGVGQLLTPPAWTVPHQPQNAGWDLLSTNGDFSTGDASTGMGFAAGSSACAGRATGLSAIGGTATGVRRTVSS